MSDDRISLASAAPSTLHGMGLRALHSIKAGLMIMSEAPMITIPACDDSIAGPAVDELFRALQNIPKVDLINFRHRVRACSAQHAQQTLEAFAGALKQPTAEFAKVVIHVFFSCSYPFAPSVQSTDFRLFHTLGLVNHSCAPSAEHYWDEELGEMVLRATRSITHGEEIFISYIDVFQNKQDRLQALGFTCKCQTCTSANSQSWDDLVEARRNELHRIDVFTSQYLAGYGGLDIANDALTTDIAHDHRSQEVMDNAQSFIAAMDGINRQIKGYIACPRIAGVLHVLYVLHEVAAISCRQDDPKKCRLNDELAFGMKLQQMTVLACGFGLLHDDTKTVAMQLLDLADGSDSRTTMLKTQIEALGGRIVRRKVDGRKVSVVEME